jgi:tyrosyl-tRNA synthetase
MATDFLNEMRWRGQVHQITNEEALRQHLASRKPAEAVAYCGFDPTAPSLTIGNLVSIMGLVRWQRAGHTPIAIVGGGTGFIGDPSGKSAERTLMTAEMIDANVAGIRRIFEPLLDFGGVSNKAKLLNNADWLTKLSYIDALRDIGKYFSVNMMIQKDSVRERLTNRDQGISYTEFSYMLLQAYDFEYLHRNHGVTVQFGASDQFGNIVCGMDLIGRRQTGAQAFGVTWPLITKSDGTKFGKTESGAVWLTRDRTSPYAFYQFWLNAGDDEVVKFLKTFTLLPQEEIAALEAAQKANPGERAAQRALARAVTEMLHGPTERDHAEAAAKALFSGDIAGLPRETLHEALASAPSSAHAKTLLEGEGVAIMDLIVQVGLAQSKREAKEFLTGGSVSVNGRKATPDERLKTGDLLHGDTIAIRRGKKNWHVSKWA